MLGKSAIGRQILVLLVGLAILVAASPMVSAAEAVTPEGVKAWFDAKFTLIAIGIGLLWKYVPVLKSWPNAAIPWLNAALYIVGKIGAIETFSYVLGVTPAHAAGGSLGGLFGVGLLGAFHAIAARQGWEGFLRPVVELVSMVMTEKRHPAATS